MTDKIEVPMELLEKLRDCAYLCIHETAGEEADALLREAAQPERYCNKCGYIGPDETHSRSEGGNCDYIACLPVTRPADEELRRDAEVVQNMKDVGLFLHHCWCDVQMNEYSFIRLGEATEKMDKAIAAIAAEKREGS